MNVLVVGAGAVGCMLAGKLLLAGHEVVLVDRPETAGQLRVNGLRLQEGGRLQVARPAGAVGSLAEAFPTGVEYELIILATKAFDVAGILQQLPLAQFPLPRQLMTIQNGVEAEPAASQVLGSNRVLSAALTIPVSSAAPGHVVIERSDRGLGLAPVAKGEPIKEWVDLFANAGITTRAFQDFKAMKWSKLFLNLVANASCAILNRRPDVIYKYWPTFMLERGMLREALAVIKGLKLEPVALPGGSAKLLGWGARQLPAMLFQLVMQTQIGSSRGEKMPSLYLDLAAGKKQSEVVFLNGAVAKAGRELNIPTPVNFTLTDTLYKLFSGRLLWEDFRGQPKALLARVREAQESTPVQK